MHGVSVLKLLFSPSTTVWTFWLAIAISTAIFVGVMFALHKLSPRAKRWLTIVCTFIAGLYFILEYLLPIHTLKDGSQGNFITPSVPTVSDFFLQVVTWTMLLGVISLAMVHGQRLFKGRTGWHNSLAFFLALIAMLVVGFISGTGHKANAAGMVYKTLFSSVLVNLDSAMFALLAFYIASAAYRAFRVRTLETALLMFAALVIMLGMVELGFTLTNGIPLSSPFAGLRLERLSQWILSWINMPSQRAVTIGVSIGALAMAMRLWLNLERGAFFSE